MKLFHIKDEFGLYYMRYNETIQYFVLRELYVKVVKIEMKTNATQEKLKHILA